MKKRIESFEEAIDQAKKDLEKDQKKLAMSAQEILKNVVIEAPETLSELIPEEDKQRFVDDEPTPTFDLKNIGMARIRNYFNDSIYAMVHVLGDGTRIIEFCQQYEDGSFGPKIKVLQEDLAMLSALDGFKEYENLKDVERHAKKRALEICKEYYGKFNGQTSEMLNPGDILSVLGATLFRLPVFHDEEENTVELWFERIIERVRGDAVFQLNRTESYCIILPYMLKHIAEEYNMSMEQLGNILRQNNMLIVQDSSRGNQKKVRVKYYDSNGEVVSKLEDVYCMMDIEYIKGRMKKKR